jgi:heterodisulfide reductase subunit A-like polyferredoxin
MDIHDTLTTMPTGFYWFFDVERKSRSILYWNFTAQVFALAGENTKYPVVGLAQGIVFAGPIQVPSDITNAIEIRAQMNKEIQDAQARQKRKQESEPETPTSDEKESNIIPINRGD